MEGIPPDVAEACSQLQSAVSMAMDPHVPQPQRLEAYNLCEHFKEMSPLCAQCGLCLARTDNQPIIRHFGLQLLEHCIKYRWNAMTQAEKVFLRDSAMGLLSSGTQHLLVEPSHIKDVLSRIVVEMAKREWPQHWPSLLADLEEMCRKGETQTELVLLVFLRLAEDVALLQTLESNQRRKDIYQALTSKMGEIFGLFVQLLQTHHYQYQQGGENALAHCHVAAATLQTLAVFIEWVPISHVTANNGKLLQILCGLLRDAHLQNAAAECLQQAVQRKGKGEERRPLLGLFNQDVMTAIFVAAAEAAAKRPIEEQHYLFLKRLTQVLTGLGAQLSALWGKDEGIGQPSNFAVYLEAMLAFTEHSSLQLASIANGLWMTFFRHELISQDPVLQNFIPKWVESTARKLVKVGSPSQSDSEACQYSRLDFESDEEFSQFFHKTRTDILDTFRQVTLLAPTITYSYAERWLLAQLQESGTEHPASWYHEWDALSMFLDSVTSRILASNRPKPSVDQGLATLRQCLEYQTSDPVALSSLLSCISALFVFLTMAPDNSALGPVLDKVFGALVFSIPGQATKESRSRVVRNVRRHAASLMVKTAQKYPLLLLPAFDRLQTTVAQLTADPHQLSKLEKVTLQEALLLVSNHFYDYARQTEFVATVVALAAPYWEATSVHFSSASAFMTFVGLDAPPVEPSTDDVNGRSRSQLLFCFDLFLAVVKRCAWPDDPERASRGGFVVGRTESGNPVCRNPAAPHICPLLPQVLQLAGVFNQLWTPQAVSHLSAGYSRSHAMLDIERDNLLGRPSVQSGNVATTPPSPEGHTRLQTPLERMQHFLSQLHDNCYHLLGNAGSSLGRDFYRMPRLPSMLAETVLANLDTVPDYRLRTVVRVFVRPFVAACPQDCQQEAVMPVLAALCPYMLARLDAKWTAMQELCEPVADEDDAQEVLEDMLNRHLTREYLEVLRAVLLGGGVGGGDDAMEDDTVKGGHVLEVVSDMGQAALRSEASCQAITLCILRALSWHDTTACLKAAALCGPVVRQLCQDGSLTPEIASHAMLSVLQGLHVHGQHEANQGALVSLGAHMYECLRQAFPCVLDVLKRIPDCNLGELHKLDEKVVQGSGGGGSNSKMEKAKKDLFKRVTSQLVGRNVGQLFKKEVHIRNLPPMQLGHRPKQIPLLDQGQSGPGSRDGGADSIGLQALFQE